MSSKETVTGIVIEAAPRGLYRVRCEDGREVLAGVSGGARVRLVKVLPGDEVKVEISPRDPKRARLV